MLVDWTTNRAEQAASDRNRPAASAFRSAVIQEYSKRPLALSFAEVQQESLPAWNLSSADRYYYDPTRGAVCFGDALDFPHTYPWRVARLEAVPRTGWVHEDGCECRSCREPLLASAGPDDWLERWNDPTP
jgi:hypothetical protein